ncbi:MAG TPA: ATP-binding protein, partial [Alteraurantiacibacter sp.]
MTVLAEGVRARRVVEGGAIALALVASATLVWLLTDEPELAATYAGGLGVIALAAWVGARRNRPVESQTSSVADWSVAVAAIGQTRRAVAITDRANRLVCANPAYEKWFGSDHAPPVLSVDRQSLDELGRAARMAWRDGEAEIETIVGTERSWSVTVLRAGRGEDHLIWRLSEIGRADPEKDISGYLSGPFGAMLSRAGMEVALCEPNGTILACNPGLARRAMGDPNATMAGQDFVSLLRSDERERIYFAREGRKGSPQTLIQIPLADPALHRGPGATAHVPSLMLLLDTGICVGGWGGDQERGIPQLEALLEQVPVGVAMTDRDGHFLFANPAFKRAVGIEQGRLPPYPSDLVIREDKTALSDAVRRYGQGASSSGDMAVRLRANPEEPVSLGIAGVRGLGEPAVLLSLADTTEETRLKHQVAQATKMQAIGQLAGGVAHDFNNVLTAIIGYCDLMLLRHIPGDSDYDDIQQIKANSNRAASLTRQLLAFSRQQTLQPEVLQLPDVISEVSQLLKRLLGAKITLRVHHDRDLGPVRADPRQLEQVIVNLAVNARDAIQANGPSDGSGGMLTFTTRRVRTTDIRRMQTEIIPEGEYTALIAEDNGRGVPPEVLGKIFEPFFTTKEQGKGTGLGLSTVYGIVKQSGGFIFADNVNGVDGKPRGARFTIYLPVHKIAPGDEPASPAEEAESEWSGGGRILLVEDEDMVRAVAERALSRAGYSVTTASDGDEGLELVQAGEKFDLVVSDVVMP